MPFKPDKRCLTCQLIALDPQLKARIYNSKYFVPGGERLSKIVEDTPNLSIVSLRRHLQNHQTMGKTDVKKKNVQAIQEISDNHDKQVQIKTSTGETVWGSIIDEGARAIKDGEMKLTANHVLKAIKDKTDYEFKKKNQDMKMAEMVWHFASGQSERSSAYDRRVIEGETATDFDPTAITARSVEQGEIRPSVVHQRDAGDATALRASEVFTEGS